MMGGRHAPPEHTGLALEALSRADHGLVQVRGRFDSSPAGNVDFTLEDGWRITVFNDCGEWDYIDTVTSPAGWSIDFDLMPSRLRHWRPEHPDRWGMKP